MENMKNQSLRFGTRVFSETVTSIDLQKRPFTVKTEDKTLLAEAIIIATGATAKRMPIKGAGEDELWQKGISACAVCDGAVPMFRNKPLAVIGGGDSALEEATFLTKYGSKVYIIHRRDELRASKIMQARAKENKKIEFLYSHTVEEACGKDKLEYIKVKDLKKDEVRDLPVAGLFFAIGHEPNTKFLNGQLKLDEQGYIVTEKGATKTSVEGVFAAGDVQDKKYRQGNQDTPKNPLNPTSAQNFPSFFSAITAAGTGCMAALEAEHFLSAHGIL